MLWTEYSFVADYYTEFSNTSANLSPTWQKSCIWASLILDNYGNLESSFNLPGNLANQIISRSQISLSSSMEQSHSLALIIVCILTSFFLDSLLFIKHWSDVMSSRNFRQVVVDDSDTTIRYIGSGWFPDYGSQDNFGNFGSTYKHTLHGTNSNDSLSFTFNGKYRSPNFL